VSPTFGHKGFSIVTKHVILFAALALIAAGSTTTASAQAKESAIPGRFVIKGTEVTDAVTGLIWRRCSEGQYLNGAACDGEATTFVWEDAVAQAVSEAGDTGVAWRLPNAKELATIVDLTRVGPAIDSAAFPNTPGLIYWTSTPATGVPAGYWAVNFDLGGFTLLSHQSTYAARLVRAGRK
jgi:hypothetical protein